MRVLSLVLMMLVLCCSGCHTMQPVDTHQWSTLQSKVEAGDTVQLVTRDGATHTFEVTTVDADAITGAPGRFAAEDIASLHVRAVSKGRAAAIGVGSVAIGYVLLSAAAVVFVLGAL